MKITAIKVYEVDLPLKEGRHNGSNDNSIAISDSTVVAVETDAGITGRGERCPLGSANLRAFAKDVRSGINELGSHVIGHDRPIWGCTTVT